MSCSNICAYPYKTFQYAIENVTNRDAIASFDKLKVSLSAVCNCVATNTLLKSNPFQYFNSLGCMVDFPKRVQRIVSLNLPIEGPEMERMFDSLMDCFGSEPVNRLINAPGTVKNWCLALEFEPIRDRLRSLLKNNSEVVLGNIKDAWIANVTTALSFLAVCFVIANSI